MSITTYLVTATLIDAFSGLPLVNAPIVIRHVGVGVGSQGSTAPGYYSKATDVNGVAVFNLVPTTGEYSETWYEVTSYHPATGAFIHNQQRFEVANVNADLDDLLDDTVTVPPNPNQELLDHLEQARNEAVAAAGVATTQAGVATDAAEEADIARDEVVPLHAAVVTMHAEVTADHTEVIAAAAAAAVSEANAAASESNAASSETNAATSEANAATDAVIAADAKDVVVAAAANIDADVAAAETAAVTATTQAGIATTGGTTATTQAGIATSAASTATTQAGISTTQAGIATTGGTTATTQAGIATSAADLAARWATEAEDIPVITGQYSAYHWAQKAAGIVMGATEGAVSVVNGYFGPSVTLTYTDVGAASAAQGSLAATAVQPADLSVYVTASALADALEDYVTVTGLSTTLAGYYTAVEVDTLVDGLATVGALNEVRMLALGAYAI